MNYNPILVVSGEPNSIFLELFFKVLKKKYNKKSNNINLIKKITKSSDEKIRI